MKKNIFTLLLSFISVLSIYADPLDTVLLHAIQPEVSIVSPKSTMLTVPVSNEVFHFSDLDAQLASYTNAASPVPPPNEDAGFATSFMLGLGRAHLSDDVRQAKKICDDAIAAGRFIDKLTGGDLVTMPIVMKKTIGQQDFYLIFQSAKIHPTYAEIEVYAKIDFKRNDFNNQNSVLYFGAKGLKFSQEKGLIEGYIGLLADYAIRLGNTNDIPGLFNNLNIKKLVAKYRKKHASFANDPNIKSIDENLFDDLSASGKSKLETNMNGQYGQEIVDEILDTTTSASEMARTSIKAKIYKHLLNSDLPICY